MSPVMTAPNTISYRVEVPSSQTVPVLLVVPPFASVSCPALGPSLLTEGCRRLKIPAKVFYANLELASIIGFELYQKINHSYSEDLLGETIFRAAAFEESNRETHQKIVDALFEGNEYTRCRENQIQKQDLLQGMDSVALFIESTVEHILAMRPQIVGFSSVFQQTLASIALARRLKQQNKDIITVLGGANASAPMGPAIVQATDVFDYVFSGEADFDFPTFCQKILEQKSFPEEQVVSCSAVYEMDLTETPNYDDYFEQLQPYQVAKKLPKELPLWLHFETSRGCWWGAKSHCTFCGLNALEMNYRRKSKDRILKDFEQFKKYGIKRLHAVDNIMPHEFHKDVLPMLAEQSEKWDLFYEVKSNLKERDLELFVRAGIHTIQPGIESLSSNVLKHMAKGVSGLQNICLLRYGISYHVGIVWNLMVGIPGETKQDYEEMLRLFPSIEHLQPPDGWGPVRLDRYSPYHSAPEKYGITEVKPFRGYYRLFPEHTAFFDVAYYFTGEYKTEFLQEADLQKRLAEAVTNWKKVWEQKKTRPKLCAYALGEDLFWVEDTRSGAKRRYTPISGESAKLLKMFEVPTPCAKIEITQQSLVNELFQQRFVVLHENHYVSVVAKAKLPKQVIGLAVLFFGVILFALLLFLQWLF